MELVGGAPSEAEGAAIVAALERFLAETAPAPTLEVQPPGGPWRRAALLEGVGEISFAAPAPELRGRGGQSSPTNSSR